MGLGQLHYQGGRGIEMDHRQALNYFIHCLELSAIIFENIRNKAKLFEVKEKDLKTSKIIP